NYVTDVSHWPELHPASQRVPVVSRPGPLQLGDTFEEMIGAGARMRRMRWQVTECHAPWVWAATGHSQTGSAVHSEIKYLLTDAHGCTRLVRELRYSVDHPLLELLNWLYFQHQIRRESAAVLANLKARCEDDRKAGALELD